MFSVPFQKCAFFKENAAVLYQKLTEQTVLTPKWEAVEFVEMCCLLYKGMFWGGCRVNATNSHNLSFSRNQL